MSNVSVLEVLDADSVEGQADPRDYATMDAFTPADVEEALLADLNAAVDAGTGREGLGEALNGMSDARYDVYQQLSQMENAELDSGQRNTYPHYKVESNGTAELRGLVAEAERLGYARGDADGVAELHETVERWEEAQSNAKAVLAGFTYEEATTVTGFGLRRVSGCKPDDTVANKLAAGALTVEGANRTAFRNSHNENSETTASEPAIETAEPTPDRLAEKRADYRQLAERVGMVVVDGDIGRPINPKVTLAQIGTHNVMAISGTAAPSRIQPIVNEDGESVGINMKVSNGYSVGVILDHDDTYTVQRLYRGKVKGEVNGVHADQVGETAYQAHAFRSNPFGEHTP